MRTLNRRFVRSTLPSLMWFVLCYECDQECRHCYARHAVERGFASPEVVARASELAGWLRLDQVVLIGGEPSLHPGVNEVIGRFASRVGAVSMVTNGNRLESAEVVRDLRSRGLSSLSISMGNAAPAPDPRVQGRVWPTIANALDQFGQENVSVALTVGCQPTTEMLDLIGRTADMGVRRFSVSYAVPRISDPASAEAFSCSPATAARRYIEIHGATRGQPELRVTFYLTMPLCLFPRPFLADMLSSGAGALGCHVLTGEGIVIDNSGGVLPCTHWVDIHQGNVLTDPLLTGGMEGVEQYWQQGPPMSLAKKLLSSVSPKCLECGLFGRACQGGCPLIWLHFDADQYIEGEPR